MQRDREDNARRQQLMQENYKKLIEIIDKVIRKPDENRDEFAKLHLESWVVASRDVVKATKALLNYENNGQQKSDEKTPSRRTLLDNLVKAMRKDLGLSAIDDKVGNIFPHVATKSPGSTEERDDDGRP
jgi:hypothetical protein